LIQINPNNDAKPAQIAKLGPLEERVLEAFWLRQEAAFIRDLVPQFPGSAYTTVMTTADRLWQKGLLGREKIGRAFRYWPLMTRTEWAQKVCGSSIGIALSRSTTRDEALLIISCLTDALAEHDPILLDKLDELIRERRVQLMDWRSPHASRES